MNIFLLGFLMVALSYVSEAGQSDNGKNDPNLGGQEKETNKSQLDKLIAQMKEQELKNEELQLQLQDQQLQLQQEIKERRQDIKELTQINRNRRSDNETDEHVKELIHAEIDPLIAGLSHCEVGSHYVAKTKTPFNPMSHQGSGRFLVTKTIYFGRSFKQTPKVFTAITYFTRVLSWKYYADWTWADSITTTKFNLKMSGYGYYIVGANWIACA